MDCYECGVKVEPESYPEGRCPSCGLTYILEDSEFPTCSECGTVGSDPCFDCLTSEDE